MPRIVQDREALVAAFRQRGVDYLAPSDATTNLLLDDATLVASAAAHPDPRIRQALIALFLLRPSLASVAQSLVGHLAPVAVAELKAAYMAAVYLQRMWSVRLHLYQGTSEELPDLFSPELSLPDPGDGHGKFGLHALAEAELARRSGNPLAEYEATMSLLFASLNRRRKEHELSLER